MNVSRPKNTDMSPEVEVSQPAGIHGWPGRDSSNPGFLSRFPVGAGAETAGPNEAASARAAIAAAVRARRNRSMTFLSQRKIEATARGRDRKSWRSRAGRGKRILGVTAL